MQELRGIEEHLEVTGHVSLHGMASSAVVKRGGRLQLHGMVHGDVIVEKGGIAEVHGVVRGQVVSQGGAQVDIWGIVEGDLAGTAVVHRGAVLAGMRQD